MESPDGVPKWKKTPEGRPAALHCLGSIYGLKQSSYLLHSRLSAFLQKHGYVPLVGDPCVYTRGPPGPQQELVACWVDDIIFLNHRDDHAGRTAFDSLMKSEFKMSEWTDGESDFILNIRIDRDWEAGTVKISQPAAISKLAAKFHLDDIKTTGAPLIPMRPDLHLQKAVGDKIINRDVFDYASVVGSLLYLSLTCRPDISVATGILSRFMACPGQEHYDAAKQVAVSYTHLTLPTILRV